MFIKGFCSYYKSYENFENNKISFFEVVRKRIDTFGHLVEYLYSLSLEFATHSGSHVQEIIMENKFICP
jgi:hypothetical protein